MVKVKTKKTLKMIVTKSKSAQAMRSGEAEVLATPAVIAHMEQAAFRILKKAYPEQTNVGIYIAVRHLRAVPIGATVQSTAIVKALDGAKVIFDVTSRVGEEVIATGEHWRFVVDEREFAEKVLK